jgi:hypothetical protein
MSTGSIRSIKSLKSIMSAFSAFSTPVRFHYGADARSGVLSPSGEAPEIPARLTWPLASAYADKDLRTVVRICSFHSLHAVSEEQLLPRVDPYWLHGDPKLKRVRCLIVMVEQGLSMSRLSASCFAGALDGAAAQPLLFAKNSPMTIQSRIVQYIFLVAILDGLWGVVSMLLDSGILDTTSEMPDSNFIQQLYESNVWFDGDVWFHGDLWLRDNTEISPDKTITETRTDLGPYALILALSWHRYRAASLLIEHRVAPYWGICHLLASSLSLRHLQNEINGIRQRGEILPNHLDLLEQMVLTPAMDSINKGSTAQMVC